MKKKIYVSAYGQGDTDRGMVCLETDAAAGSLKRLDFCPLGGKSNLVIPYGDVLITSVSEKSGNYLLKLQSDTYDELDRVKTKYFYNFGQQTGDYLLLGSYESGVDSVAETDTLKILAANEHAGPAPGKTHCFLQSPTHKYYALDNALDRIYIYDSVALERYRIIGFGDTPYKGIRLMRWNEQAEVAYINTENTNEILVFDYASDSVKESYPMTDGQSISGGLDINAERTLLAVSLRGEDAIVIYRVKAEGKLEKMYRFPCGRIPRDIRFEGSCLLVSCTKDNVVQLYEIGQERATLADSAGVNRPVTFSV